MDVLDAIRSRRSVREFTGDAVGEGLIQKILDAGRWTPSGLNNQPWKFKVLRGEEKNALASCTKYGRIIEGASVCVTVYLDEQKSYDRTKDVQSIGACIQNMLLAAHNLGLGAVWLGEILNKREEAEKILSAPESCELMAVIAVGHPLEKILESTRRRLDELML